MFAIQKGVRAARQLGSALFSLGLHVGTRPDRHCGEPCAGYTFASAW